MNGIERIYVGRKMTVYVETNSNPNKRVKAKDDVVRAISIATGLKWEVVFDDLCILAKRLHRMPHEIFVYEKYLDGLGYHRHKSYRGVDGIKRVTIEQFCKDKPIGTFIIKIRGRLTVVKNGKLLDTYNCLKNSVGSYWFKK